MSTINKVILVGRAGKDPEVKTTKDGKKVASITLATNDYQKDAQGNQKTQWHNVTLWESLAEVAEKYLKKGDQFYIEGRLSYEEYEKEGVKKNYTRVTASNLTLLGSKKDNVTSDDSAEAPAAAPAPAKAAKAAAPAAAPAMADTDSDLPF
jgi:single-strand DNA-binding protein